MKSQNKVWFMCKMFALFFVFLLITADEKAFAQNEKGFDNPVYSDDKPVELGKGQAKSMTKTKVVVSTKIVIGRKNSKINKPPENYVVDETFKEAVLGNGNEYIGFTFWRVNKTNSNNTKDLVDESNYQRVEDDTRLAEGDIIKLMFSSSRSGYLYVINYELRTDGSRGKASLIFPKLNYFGGDNYIKALYPFVPPPKGGLTVRNKTEAGKIKEAEVLIIIVSPEKLELPKQLSERAMELTESDITNLLKDSVRLDKTARLQGGIAQKPSAKEKTAFNSKDLVDETTEQDDSDPLPQSLLMGAAKKNQPVWVKVKLYTKP